MEILFILLTCWGGYELFSGDTMVTQTEDTALIEVAPQARKSVYARGEYYRSENGYLISDLSKPSIAVLGCHRPILTSDLSSPSTQEKRVVTAVTVSCEG